MANDSVKLVRDITGRHGVTAPTVAAEEIVKALAGSGDAYRQFAGDVMTIWANWTSGGLAEEDAMAAISARHNELRLTLNDAEFERRVDAVVADETAPAAPGTHRERQPPSRHQ